MLIDVPPATQQNVCFLPVAIGVLDVVVWVSVALLTLFSLFEKALH